MAAPSAFGPDVIKFGTLLNRSHPRRVREIDGPFDKIGIFAFFFKDAGGG
jgi:hypothetical protein